MAISTLDRYTVLFAAVALYFLFACLVSWLVLFPASRPLVLQTFTTARGYVGRRWRHAAQRRAYRMGLVGAWASSTWRRARAALRQHWWLCLGCAMLLALPPVLALLSGQHTRLGGFDESQRQVNSHVAALLDGEQLVPPPALPPLAFASEELQKERPLIASASRDWAKLNSLYEQRLLLAFRIMKEQHGYDMAILEGYRSPERQNMLAALGPGVTNAAAFQSWHQYGLAADCAFVRNGKIVISEKDPWAMRGYLLYGQVAESLGLTWGGRWKMMDLGHTELRLPGVMKR